MIPQPPFPWDFDPAGERAAFDALKGRLEGLWGDLFPGDDQHYTSVVVPSQRIGCSSRPSPDFQEERLLFLLIRLRNPRARMVYVTSRPLHPLVLEYYLELVAGVPASHVRAHLTLLCAHDATPRPLAAKILERPRLLQRIRSAIFDPSRAYLTVCEATPLERRLAVMLDLPLNGADPGLAGLATRSGAREVFGAAGVPVPLGIGGLRDADDVAAALVELKHRAPYVLRAAVRLDDAPAGAGHGIVPLADVPSAPGDRAALARIETTRPGDSRDAFIERIGTCGAVVEEVVEGAAASSAEFRVNPRRRVIAVSTHDRILGGPTGHAFAGCRFPAAPAHRDAIRWAGERIATVLAGRGVVSRVGVVFAVSPAGAGRDVKALGIELGIGRVTHPMLALRFLTGGSLDASSGAFVTPAGLPKAYRSTDALWSERYRGLLPEDLVDIVTVNRLRYDRLSETGVLFHLIGGLSETGSLGLTAIGADAAEADRIFDHAVAVLDRECACNVPPSQRLRG
jgi:PGM1 C-terminal domain